MGIRTNTEAVKQGPSTGKAAIGGPFRVINHHGKHVTEKDFMGKWTLLYFGFTHCPDICLEELQKLAAAVDKIKEKAGIETVPVFISIDPERDIVEQVGEYVKEFHPKLIGLTGSPDELLVSSYQILDILAICLAISLHSQIVSVSWLLLSIDSLSGYAYAFADIYLMSLEMEFVKFFGMNNDVDSLTDGVIKEVAQHKK
ncbi:hypothetical protein JHK82_044588 [Glycine max]|nr:hypothetical protein JHK82_044588 [Glycine max]